jgi:predicted AlkP superfamily phosphohydrolase/phosphomutase
MSLRRMGGRWKEEVRVARTAIIGLDGATFRLLDLLCDAGVMPSLATLRASGVDGVLRSTTPAYTPPAWVSMLTGVNPGRHNVYGFLSSTPQEPVKIAHAGTIAATPIWRFANEREARIGVYNVPMTFPPATDVNGFLVSGGLAAGWTSPDVRGFASDEEVGSLITQVTGDAYPIDTVVSYENDWSRPEVIDEVSAIQAKRRRVLEALLERRDVDLLFAVFEGPDRLQHLHYQYLVESSEWFGRPEAQGVRDRAWSYFQELDGAVADIVAWAGEGGNVMVVSDHGAGPWEKTLNMNLLLDEWGFLRLPAVSKLTRTRLVAGPVQAAARKLLPRSVLLSTKSRINRGLDWSTTRAFASQVAEQGIHVNEMDGALPHGIVDRADVPALEAELVERLLGLVDPDDGAPVVDAVIRRAEVATGPFVARAPHLFPICRDQRIELSDTLAASSVLTDHRDRPWGYHHQDGVFIGAGPAFVDGSLPRALEIVDVLPTAFTVAGLPVPDGLDGRVPAEILTVEAQKAHGPSEGVAERTTEGASSYPFSEEDEKQIEESLRGLGYIE